TDLRRLASIPGQPPSLVSPPPGCAFHPRCRLRRGRDRCVRERPPLAPVGGGHRSACHFSDEMGSEIRKVAVEMGVDPTGGAR
ncbi:MAG TPA: oligopeptide/dipeptide ABC transporter ATP-binding protein, partial [Egibacteraceae bacterium]|nr:oligopeptide/dipeptide ABC transporter ATP-binding protein [Egibacteraceae bacterium]